MPVTVTTQGLNIDGKFVPVYSGTVHYWRLEREKWSAILDRVKALGFGMIETYIPWSVHETKPGQFDWGQIDPRKDVEAFIRLCQEKNLYLIVRPGPLINAELTDFGFPEWVLLDPEVQARTALDTIHYDAAFGLHPPHQFPVPSYASEKFYRYVEGWFDALCPILARHLAPNGSIVAVQSDNETCYLFHDQPYATDYAADSLRLYQRFLRDQYLNIETVNTLYHKQYNAFDEIEPPRDCEIETRDDVPRHLDWVKYKEYQIRYAVARIARIIKARGVRGVPIFHDVAFQYETPLDIAALEADPDIDWVGMNLYRNKEDYAGAATRVRFLAGETRLPFIPEFGAGLWSHHPRTFMPEEHEFITLTALMHGLKAFNFYMLVERDRWQGSPITRHGALRPEYAQFYRRLNEFLGYYHFWEYEKKRDTIVLFNYDLGRFSALASTLHYAHVDLLGLPPQLFKVPLDLGFKWDPAGEAAIEPSNWLGTLTALLGAQHIPYDFGDTHLNTERLLRYATVCVPTADFLDSRAQSELLAYAHAGGHLLFGPGLPYLTPALEECRFLANLLNAPGSVAHGSGCVTWLTTPELETAFSELIPLPEYRCTEARIDLAQHRAPDSGTGKRELLFAANPDATAITATLSFRGVRQFKPAWWSSPELEGEGEVAFSIAPYTVHVWEVVRD